MSSKLQCRAAIFAAAELECALVSESEMDDPSIMPRASHLIVTVNQMHDVGNDGIARVLGGLAHHAEVQVAQVTGRCRQEVSPAGTHLAHQT